MNFELKGVLWGLCEVQPRVCLAVTSTGVEQLLIAGDALGTWRAELARGIQPGEGMLSCRRGSIRKPAPRVFKRRPSSFAKLASSSWEETRPPFSDQLSPICSSQRDANTADKAPGKDSIKGIS